VVSAQHAKHVHSSLSTGFEFPNFLLAVIEVEDKKKWI
jgi:hypothetical protein